MAEVLVEFGDPVTHPDGAAYIARACGSEMSSGTWQGWIEFLPVADGEPVRSGRETTQPNRQDTVYWATGLTPIYLQGALRRALQPLRRPVSRDIQPAIFDGPAPRPETPATTAESVLNPFSVYRKGEALLRRQLAALSGWHLVNIIRDQRLSDRSGDELGAMEPDALVELIISAVRRREREAVAER